MNDQIRSAEEAAARHGSSAPAALGALHEFLGGASVDELRQVVGLSPSGAVRLIDKLEPGILQAKSWTRRADGCCEPYSAWQGGG